MITDRHTNLSYKVTALSKDFFFTIIGYLSLTSMNIKYFDIVGDSGMNHENGEPLNYIFNNKGLK